MSENQNPKGEQSCLFSECQSAASRNEKETVNLAEANNRAPSAILENHRRVRELAMLAISVSVALLLSYVEFLLPPVWSAVPGIKLGLANSAVLFLIYKTSPYKAAAVSLVRVSLSALLFGSVLSFIYSLAGAILSFAVMIVMKKCDLFSIAGVSVCGAVMHNAAQIAVAAALLRTREIGFYMLPLSVSGIICGVFIGLITAMLIKKVKIKF